MTRPSLRATALTVALGALLASPGLSRGQGSPAPYPKVAQLPRPKQLWLQHPTKLEGALVHAEEDGPVFALRGERNQLVAMDPATGRPPWTVPVPTGAKQGFQGPDRLDLAQGVLVVWGANQVQPTVLSRDSGKLLWRSPEACRLQSAGGRFLLLECLESKGDRYRVVRADSGKPVATFALDLLDRTALDERALYVWSYDRRRLRKYALVEGEPIWERPAPAGKPATMLAVDGVLLYPGREVHALDGRTGQSLWSRRPPGDYRGPYVEPALHRGQVLLSTEDALVLVAPRTGAEEKRYELPPFLRTRQHPGLNAMRVLLSGERAVVSYPRRITTEGVLVTWARPGAPPVVLRRPALGGLEEALVGDTLVSTSSFDETLAAHSLRVLEPPLAELPEAAALEAIHAELPTDRLRYDVYSQLPRLRPYLLRRVRDPRDKERGSALWALEDPEDATLVPLYLELMKDSGAGRLPSLATRGLSGHDEPLVSERLAALWRTPPPAGRRERYQDAEGRGAAVDQLWRTGRTTKLGLCPATTRPLADLGSAASAGVFGTAHPLVLEAYAPDGRWLSVCQARTDTDGDGDIEVMFGHHGDAMGDDLRPYLIVGGGAGHGFDELLGADPRGRYVAVREGACLVLIDTAERTATTLPDADLRDDQPAFGQHRAISFDAIGECMLYLRGDPGGSRPVVRNLRERRDTQLDPGGGTLWQARLDPLGRSVLVQAVPGRRWPHLATTLAARSCRGPAMSYSSFGGPPAKILTRVVPVAGGPPRQPAGVVMPFGADLLVRDAAGAILVERAGGVRQPLAPASCQAEVAHADPGRKLIVALCAAEADDQGRTPFWIFGASGGKRLDSRRSLGGGDGWFQSTSRFVDVGDGTIDLDQRQPGQPAPGPRELQRLPAKRPPGGQPPRALLRRGDGHTLQADSAAREILLGPLRWHPPARR